MTDFYPYSRGSKLEYRSGCKPCLRSKRRTYYKIVEGKDVPYAQLLKREYGMTLDQYNELLRKQANRCAVCRRPETIVQKQTGVPQRLAVDHDHVTGEIRGLLCHRCNMLVWAMEDNHTTLAAIEAYIEGFRAAYANGTHDPLN